MSTFVTRQARAIVSHCFMGRRGIKEENKGVAVLPGSTFAQLDDVQAPKHVAPPSCQTDALRCLFYLTQAPQFRWHVLEMPIV